MNTTKTTPKPRTHALAFKAPEIEGEIRRRAQAEGRTLANYLRRLVTKALQEETTL